MGTGEGPEFNDKSYSNRGSYEVIILPIAKITDINLVPDVVRDKLVFDLKNDILRI